MFIFSHADSQNHINEERKCNSCQNCHHFHRYYVHKYLLARCQAFNQLVDDPERLCYFWTKRYYPPLHYLTIKQ